MINIEVYQVTKQDDGSYEAGLNFIENGKIIQRKMVQASSKAEFKDKIRVFKERIEQVETQKQSLIRIVQEAINEVMAEV